MASAAVIEQEPIQKDFGRRFRVTTGSVGAFSKGEVFQESTFQRLNDPNPAYTVGKTDAGQQKSVPRNHPSNDKGYYDALLARLLALGVIETVHDETPCSAVPIGPGGQYGAAAGSIADSTESVLRSRRVAVESVAMRPPEGAPQDRLVNKNTGVVTAV